jgi:chemotaxis protein histidine kinase CheA
MRHAHNLKGAARAVELSLIEERVIELEEILSAVKKTPKLLEQHLIQMLFGVLGWTGGSGEAAAQTGVSGRISALRCVDGNGDVHRDNASDRRAESRTQRRLLSAVKRKAPPQRFLPLQRKLPPHAVQWLRRPLELSLSAMEQGPSRRLSVRIETDKLDLLLSRSGELLAARQRLRLTSDRLAGLSESLGVLHADWRRYAKTIGQLEAAAAPHGSAGLPVKNRELWTETPQRLQALLTELDKLRLSFREEWRYLDHAGAALDQQVSRIRMLPFAHSCVGL